MLCETTLCCLDLRLSGSRVVVGIPAAVVAAEDMGAWPYSVGLLVNWEAGFWG